MGEEKDKLVDMLFNLIKENSEDEAEDAEPEQKREKSMRKVGLQALVQAACQIAQCPQGPLISPEER